MNVTLSFGAESMDELEQALVFITRQIQSISPTYFEDAPVSTPMEEVTPAMEDIPAYVAAPAPIAPFPVAEVAVDAANPFAVAPAPVAVSPAPVSIVAEVAAMPEEELLPDVDAEGVTWDKRIHSSGKTLNKSSGKWNKRKQVDPDLYARVTTELRGLAPVTDAPAVNPVVAPSPVVAVSPTAPDPAFGTVADFPAFMQKLTQRQTSAVGVDYMNCVATELAKNGLATVTELHSRTDLLPIIDQELDVKWQILSQQMAPLTHQ